MTRFVCSLLIVVGVIVSGSVTGPTTAHAERARAALTAIAIPAGTAPLRIDGSLGEPIWNEAMSITDFVQRDPTEGAPASHQTDVRVAFDESSIYVAVRALDPHPTEVVGLLTRRDDSSPSDWIAIYIDSFLDRRTAYEFRVNASGVKSDTYWFNDTNSDRSWDAVWDAAAMRTEEGWQAEFRVPFSQLRFRGGDTAALGFAVSREIAHLNETSTWPLLARSASGYVSSFGDLNGVRRSGAQKKLELMPFMVGQVETSPVEEGNPLTESTNPGGTMGLDVKYQVAPGLTLTGTVNPDFGQVEADPAVVNLGAFETFFSERRPFFVEGSGNLSFNDYFYSRRIGRTPQRFPDTPDGGFVEQPSNTTILGAAKLTGKVGAFAIGALHAVTAKEYARVASGPGLETSRTPVEPATHYSVGRASREFADNSRLSFMVTSTRRSLTEELDFLASSALTAGVDGDWRLGKQYSLTGSWTGSSVRGSTEAITRLQKNNVHSFQRPDARGLLLDEGRTSMIGHSGGLSFSKIGGTRTRGNVNVGFRSPGFDVNDLGFRSRADDIWQEAWFQVRDDVPKGLVRRKNINFNQWQVWNFSGDRRELGGNINSHWTFVNNWSIGSGLSFNTESFSDRHTRGGPGALRPANINGWSYFDSDNRKFLTLNLYADWFKDMNGSYNWGERTGVTLRPTAALSTSISLNFNRNVNPTQWVTNVEETDRTRFVFGHLDQHTASITVRVNYTITPALSIQVYGQPFASSGDYMQFKELVNGRAANDNDRYAVFDYLDNPDFRIRSFRMTNVLRWEYRPGSAFFVVWQQGREDFNEDGQFRFGRDLGGSLSAPSENTFLIKVSRWFNY